MIGVGGAGKVGVDLHASWINFSPESLTYMEG
jgi:hypothetical protein